MTGPEGWRTGVLGLKGFGPALQLMCVQCLTESYPKTDGLPFHIKPAITVSPKGAVCIDHLMVSLSLGPS
jgi:hypothetical protein